MRPKGVEDLIVGPLNGRNGTSEASVGVLKRPPTQRGWMNLVAENGLAAAVLALKQRHSNNKWYVLMYDYVLKLCRFGS